MAVPRANPSGLYGSGQFPVAPHIVDVSGAIQAFTQGAGSLIHGAFLRKMAQQNYALQLQRLKQEGELHQSQLAALEAYRQATVLNRNDRLAAPDARATKANQKAFGSLQTEFPTHPYVAPDPDSGEAPVFDPNSQQDYVGALKAARAQKAASDAELARHTDQLDTLQRAATLRDWVTQHGIAARAAAASSKAPTPAQTRLQKNDFLAKVATLSDGDPDKAEAIIANDKQVAAEASRLGVQSYELRAAAQAVGTKTAAKATDANVKLQSSGMVPGAKGGTPTPADINAARSSLTVPAPTTPITPLAIPRAPAPGVPPAPAPAAAGVMPPSSAPLNRLPPVRSGPVPAAPTPLRTPNLNAPGPAASPATPAAVPKLLATPGAPPAPTVAAPATPATKPPLVDETALDHHALWNLKVSQGMKPTDATAYVLKAKGPQTPPPAPVVAAPQPDEEDEASAAAAPVGV